MGCATNIPCDDPTFLSMGCATNMACDDPTFFSMGCAINMACDYPTFLSMGCATIDGMAVNSIAFVLYLNAHSSFPSH